MNLPLIISFFKRILSRDFILRHRGYSMLLLFVLSIWAFKGITENNDLRLEGDGLEYVLMTEAFNNHFSPDIRAEDIDSYRKKAEKVLYRKYESKSEEYDRLLGVLANTSLEKGTDLGGFSVGRNNKLYSIHFYTYSLCMTPMVWLFKPFNIHPIKVFWYSNALFLLLVVFLILFCNTNREIINISIALLFFFSVFQWYSVWPHPEIFICSLMFAGLWLFVINKRHYLGLFLTCVAATQFQPFALMPALLALEIFRIEKYQWMNLLKLGCILVVVLLPSLFYFTNFGVTNMVKNLGYLDTKYITFNRVFGFFFDLNQGLVVAFPLLFIAYLIMFLLSIFQFIKKRKESSINFTYFILPVIVFIVVISSSMGNWNGGGSITHRYVNYIAALMLFHIAYLILSYRKSKWILAIVILLVFSQIVIVSYFNGFKANGWAYVVHKEWPKYILDHHPEDYNPDPRIFMVRTAGARSDEYFGRGVVYLDDNLQFKKAVVHQDSLTKSVIGNLNAQQLRSLIQNKSNEYGWVYINESDVRTYLGAKAYSDFLTEAKVQYFVNKVRDDQNAMESFRKLELSNGLPLSESVRKEAMNLLNNPRK